MNPTPAPQEAYPRPNDELTEINPDFVDQLLRDVLQSQEILTCLEDEGPLQGLDTFARRMLVERGFVAITPEIMAGKLRQKLLAQAELNWEDGEGGYYTWNTRMQTTGSKDPMFELPTYTIEYRHIFPDYTTETLTLDFFRNRRHGVRFASRDREAGVMKRIDLPDAVEGLLSPIEGIDIRQFQNYKESILDMRAPLSFFADHSRQALKHPKVSPNKPLGKIFVGPVTADRYYDQETHTISTTMPVNFISPYEHFAALTEAIADSGLKSAATNLIYMLPGTHIEIFRPAIREGVMYLQRVGEYPNIFAEKAAAFVLENLDRVHQLHQMTDAFSKKYHENLHPTWPEIELPTLVRDRYTKTEFADDFEAYRRGQLRNYRDQTEEMRANFRKIFDSLMAFEAEIVNATYTPREQVERGFVVEID